MGAVAWPLEKEELDSDTASRNAGRMRPIQCLPSHVVPTAPARVVQNGANSHARPWVHRHARPWVHRSVDTLAAMPVIAGPATPLLAPTVEVGRGR